MYIQEYNNISYLSIGVISDKTTDNARAIGMNIQLHHKNNPDLNKSTDITREFNIYQRSAGCPTFMLSNDLSDYYQKDGSFLITITLSPVTIPSDIQYPGINDIIVSSGDKSINMPKDLLFHYCGHFKSLPNTDKFSADIFPIASLRILLDLLYHRSTALTYNNIPKLLNISEMILCQYAHKYCDRLLANQYRNKSLSINRTETFMINWDLPQLREMMTMREYVEPRVVPYRPPVIPPEAVAYFRANNIDFEEPRLADIRTECCSTRSYTDQVPSVARIVEPWTIRKLVDTILPLEVFEDESERARLCEQFNAPHGLLKLGLYQKALCTLEGVPRQLRMDLQNTYQSAISLHRGFDRPGLRSRLGKFAALISDDGFEELVEKAKVEAALVKQAMEELIPLLAGLYVGTPSINAILTRREVDCRMKRRMAARMFVDWLRKWERTKMEEGKAENGMRDWIEYFGVSAYKF